MKKIISLMLTAIICFSFTGVYAQAASVPEETLIMMGDVNGDGRVSANDARAVLRMSAGLELSDGVKLASVDADNNGKISSADARIILRVAASIAGFSYGFDGKGLANSVKALINGNYYIDAKIEDMDIVLAKKDDNIYMTSSDVTKELAGMGITDCGLMINNGGLYITGVNKSKKFAMFIPESLYGEMGMTKNEITSVTDIIGQIVPANIGEPSKVTVNGTDYIAYRYDTMGSGCVLYTDMSGMIKSIDTVYPNGTIETDVIVNSMSADVPADYLNLDLYEII